MEKEEIWKDIEGYEGLYQVSNLGRVRSFDRIDRLGRLRPGVILRPLMNTYGYIQVSFCKEGKEKKLQVHRLVAQAFIPNPEGLPQINHKDENPKNNRVDNLEWCDGKYNCNYGTRNERQVQTMISKGLYDPELCGIGDRKKYQREWARKYRRRKKSA